MFKVLHVLDHRSMLSRIISTKFLLNQITLILFSLWFIDSSKSFVSHPFHYPIEKMATTSQARASLATPAQPGTLSAAYRRSLYALQNVFSSNPDSSQQAEREPLLNSSGVPNGNGEGSSTGATRYGSVLDLPPEQRVPKPKKVSSQVRVEAKVWFANEVSRRLRFCRMLLMRRGWEARRKATTIPSLPCFCLWVSGVSVKQTSQVPM